MVNCCAQLGLLYPVIIFSLRAYGFSAYIGPHGRQGPHSEAENRVFGKIGVAPKVLYNKLLFLNVKKKKKKKKNIGRGVFILVSSL